MILKVIVALFVILGIDFLLSMNKFYKKDSFNLPKTKHFWIYAYAIYYSDNGVFETKGKKPEAGIIEYRGELSMYKATDYMEKEALPKAHPKAKLIQILSVDNGFVIWKKPEKEKIDKMFKDHMLYRYGLGFLIKKSVDKYVKVEREDNDNI